jgi:hypothetical protein
VGLESNKSEKEPRSRGQVIPRLHRWVVGGGAQWEWEAKRALGQALDEQQTKQRLEQDRGINESTGRVWTK